MPCPWRGAADHGGGTAFRHATGFPPAGCHSGETKTNRAVVAQFRDDEFRQVAVIGALRTGL
jgi:hypothetical protein